MKVPSKQKGFCPDCGSRNLTCRDCGSVFTAVGPSKPRSYPQLKRYFGVIRAALHHWPEGHDFQPRNADHLRYWLEVKAGHFTVEKTIRCNDVDPKRLATVLTAVMLSSEDERLFIEVEGPCVYVKRALSVSYGTLAHLNACAIFTAVEQVVEAEIGIGADRLLEEMENAA